MSAITGRPGLTADELAAIEARLPIGGLFLAHAHTDVTRLLGEVHRLRQALTAARIDLDPPIITTGRPVATSNGASR